MRKLSNIFLGWWFWITNFDAPLAQERLRFCKDCPSRIGILCGECGCVLKAKARLMDEECPLDRWPSWKNTIYK